MSAKNLKRFHFVTYRVFSMEYCSSSAGREIFLRYQSTSWKKISMVTISSMNLEKERKAEKEQKKVHSNQGQEVQKRKSFDQLTSILRLTSKLCSRKWSKMFNNSDQSKKRRRPLKQVIAMTWIATCSITIRSVSGIPRVTSEVRKEIPEISRNRLDTRLERNFQSWTTRISASLRARMKSNSLTPRCQWEARKILRLNWMLSGKKPKADWASTISYWELIIRPQQALTLKLWKPTKNWK